MLSDVSHDMGEPAGLEKDGVEKQLQEELAAQPEALEPGLRLVRREWPTDIGPVDLVCRDEEDGWVAVEIKRVAGIEAVEQLTRYLERICIDPELSDCRGILAAQKVRHRRARSPRRAAPTGSRSISRFCAASASRTSCSSGERRARLRDALDHARQRTRICNRLAGR